MNSYLKLVHMEINRFKYILAGLMTLTLLSQFGAVVWESINAVSYRENGSWKNGVSIGGTITSPPKLTLLEIISSSEFFFMAPIMLSIGVLTIYVFLIWYRDWFGRDTFIYRLLTLPSARRNIYFAKVTAIFMFLLGLVSFQLALLPVEEFIFNLIVPSDIRDPSYISEIIYENRAFPLLVPWYLDRFLINYGLGMIAVLSIFTAILIERSYRRVGVIYAILYLAICLGAILFPLLGLGLGNINGYLYPNEIYAIELAVCIGVVTLSIWIGCKLLTKKITV